LIGRLDRLAVEDRGRGPGRTAHPLTVGHHQGVLHPIPHAFALPAAQVVVDRLPRRPVVRPPPPRHPGAQEVEDGAHAAMSFVFVVVGTAIYCTEPEHKR
jgi:hypothetical protein